jgi:hypothetical protein
LLPVVDVLYGSHSAMICTSKARLFGTVVAVALLLLVTSLRAISGAHAQTQNVHFRWAVGAWTGPPSARSFASLTADAALHAGDELQLFVSPVVKCHVYVLLHDSRGDVTMLFPKSLSQFDTGYRAGGAYYVPSESSRLRLDDQTGTETLHILASAQRLQKLEDLLTAYKTADSAGQPPLVRAIVAEVRELKRRHQPLQTAAERPLAIAGRTRTGPAIDVADVAIEVRAVDFYSKTLTIDHQ